MKIPTLLFTSAILAAAACGADAPTELPEVAVYSPRVANQAPVESFPMPVSALRFEPRVDLQGRSLVEGQADVTIRGGTFENTGFRIGSVTVLDPQTGHYLAEIPVAPEMLGAPTILTGSDLAVGVTNATVGAVQYDWRPIRTGGVAQVAAGPHELWRADLYQGYVAGPVGTTWHTGADVDVAHSESNGAIAFADHRFDRVNARLQLAGGTSQTDVFVGYQAKFFGLPNLYTPFNSDESENLETLLVAVNQRFDLGDGDYVNAGVYHRRNKDDYAFNRFAPLGLVHPYQHTTWQDGAALEGRRDFGTFALRARAEVLADDLKSTTLNFGRFHSRTLAKVSAVPEKTWTLADGGAVTAQAGATYDDSNRDSGHVSPVAELARTFAATTVRRVYASYAETTQEPTYTALNSSAAGGLFRGNPNLGREISRNAEIGIAGATGGWSYQAAAFGRRDESLVDWTFRRDLAQSSNGRTARTANAMDVDTAGVELVARRSWSAVDIVLGYTGLAKNPDYRGAPVDASFYALNYARQRLTAAATVRLGHGFELRVDNVARIQASNVLRTQGGDSAVLSTVALAYKPEAWRGLELTAEVDNLWDSRFQDVPGVPAMPRGWSIGANYVW